MSVATLDKPDVAIAPIPNSPFQVGQLAYLQGPAYEDEDIEFWREDCVIVGIVWVDAIAAESLDLIHDMKPGFNYVCRSPHADRSWCEIWHESDLHHIDEGINQ